MTCFHCNTMLQARSLPCNLATLHGVYQLTVVAEELLDKCASITFKGTQHPGGQLQCPSAGCLGFGKDRWNMQHHFQDLHPWDKVIVPKEGWSFSRCCYCQMQVNLAVTGHWKTESCSIGMDRRVQRNAAITLALTFCCTFTVHGDILERVKVFKYLGCLFAQDDDNVQAVRQQIRKARGIWACIGQVLRGENASPCIAAKFYKAVVQSVLLYGSKTWNLTKVMLVRLEGFHIHAVYGNAQEHKPRKGLFGKWKYPSTKDVLKRCGLHSVKDYIDTRCSTIAMYVVNHPIFNKCKEGEQRRGSMLRQWW